MSDFYKRVYEQHDPAPEGGHGWIQWKGTEVCIDLHCPCGAHSHVDADFFYYFRCPKCLATFAVGMHVKLIPLTPELLTLGEVDEKRIIVGEVSDY